MSCEGMDDGASAGPRTPARSDAPEPLIRAIARHEIHVLYQPVVDLRTGTTVGHEALARWATPHGTIPPHRFVPEAECDGTVVALDLHVLERAAADCAELSRRTGRDLFVTVNFSARHFAAPGLVESIADVLGRTGLAPRRLVAEVTESAALDLRSAADQLGRIRAIGARIALDDFGTGFSSLSYLMDLPTDVVKIDRSFTTRLDPAAGQDAGAAGPPSTVRRARAIVRAVLQACEEIDVRVVVEGIENARQAATVVGWGAHLGQGYYFAPPLTLEQAAARLGPGR